MKRQYCGFIGFILKVLADKCEIVLAKFGAIFANCKHSNTGAVLHTNFSQYKANTKNTGLIIL